MYSKEKGNTHSIRALVDSRSLTMVSIALLVHRSSRGKEDSSRESKEIKERKGKSKKKRIVETLTLTLREKGRRGLTWVQPPAPPPATGRAGAQQRADSPAHRSEPPLVDSGHLLHARARTGHHHRAARRRRAPTRESTRAGERAGGGAAATFPGVHLVAAAFFRGERRRGGSE